MSDSMTLLGIGPSKRPKVDDWMGKFTTEGWITRSGKFIPCDRMFGHPLAACMALGGDEDTAELRAERLGWIRLSDYGDRMRGEPNQSQINALWDWCEALKCDYEKILKGIKRL